MTKYFILLKDILLMEVKIKSDHGLGPIISKWVGGGRITKGRGALTPGTDPPSSSSYFFSKYFLENL